MKSLTGVKRARAEAEVIPVPVYATSMHSRVLATHKRSRRGFDLTSHSDMSNLLQADNPCYDRFSSRMSFIHSLNVSADTVVGLLNGLDSDMRAFLGILDLNLFQTNIMHVVNDYACRGVSMTTLNIRGHSFCMGDRRVVLRSFMSAYGHYSVACDIVNYVADQVFANDTKLSINVLSGGGVRDVLISEWCKMYNITNYSSSSPPHIIFVHSQSGRVFLIPIIV